MTKLILIILMLSVNLFAEVRKTYYKNGHLKADVLYENGKLEGIFKQYYKNGNLKAQRLYKNGKAISDYKYSIDGKRLN